MTLIAVLRKAVSSATAALLLSFSVNPANACTGITLIATDGTVVHARTLEFAIDLQSNVVVVPRGASDLRAKRFYFRTYENSQIRMVDLTKMNLDAKEMVSISMKGDEVVRTLTM